MQADVQAFWDEFAHETGATGPFTAWAFGLENAADPYQVSLADELAQLVLHGPKRATMSLLSDFGDGGDPLPRVGDHSVILDGRGSPVCIIRTASIEPARFGDVGADFAWHEGEGDRTLQWWRGAHQRFYERIGKALDDDTPVLLERFEKVWPLHGMLGDEQADAMAAAIAERIEICRLDLAGITVLTEAATGAYAATAAAAAAAGGHVYAVTRDSEFGSAADAVADVMALASRLRAPAGTIAVVARDDLPADRAGIVTNSGFLRPIDSRLIERLPGDAVIALMYEAWEARASDIDFDAAARRGIAIIGVNEHHPACGAFDSVGDLVVHAARDRGWELAGATVGVISDNAFAGPVARALDAAGSSTTVIDSATTAPAEADIVVVATTPPVSSQAAQRAAMSPEAVSELALATGAARCIQLWGDVDRSRIGDRMEFLPDRPPRPGHQGIPMTAAGFEPVIRLQVAGLAAVIHRDAPNDSPFADFAQRVPPRVPKQQS